MSEIPNKEKFLIIDLDIANKAISFLQTVPYQYSKPIIEMLINLKTLKNFEDEQINN